MTGSVLLLIIKSRSVQKKQLSSQNIDPVWLKINLREGSLIFKRYIVNIFQVKPINIDSYFLLQLILLKTKFKLVQTHLTWYIINMTKTVFV